MKCSFERGIMLTKIHCKPIFDDFVTNSSLTSDIVEPIGWKNK
jgi:hypothetical protein